MLDQRQRCWADVYIKIKRHQLVREHDFVHIIAGLMLVHRPRRWPNIKPTMAPSFK